MRKFWVYFLNRLVLNGRGEINKLLFVSNLSKFEKEIKTKIGRSDTMGTQEYLLDKAEKKGFRKGLRLGLKKARLKARGKKLLLLYWSLRKWVLQ
ncbi:MAG: hypothetical protein ACN6O7_21305 [Sphingobacterium sp.]